MTTLIEGWDAFWLENNQTFSQMNISEGDAQQHYLMSPFSNYPSGLSDFGKAAMKALEKTEKVREMEISREATLLAQKYKKRLPWNEQPAWIKTLAVVIMVSFPFIAAGFLGIALGFNVLIYNVVSTVIL